MNSNNQIYRIVFFSWLLVGTLDIFAAFTDYFLQTGKGPENILRYMASGFFGENAFEQERVAMNFFGLFFHYLLALSFTLFFFLIYIKTNFIKKLPVFWIIFYGIFMWFVTTQIIIPISHIPQQEKPVDIAKYLKAVIILICMISLPLYLIAQKYIK